MATTIYKHARHALILGTHSFVDGSVKVGSQHIAEGLARQGWGVHYISVASSPFDLWGRLRRCRLRRVWLHGQDIKGFSIAPGLTEYAFKAMIPAHRFFLRQRWQLRTWGLLLPEWFRRRHYDVCLHETTPNIVYLPYIQAARRIFRLSDAPSGFAGEMPDLIMAQFFRNMAVGFYDDIWAVSQPLADDARALNPLQPVTVIPNGLDAGLFLRPATVQPRTARSAVFIGDISQKWLDLPLLEQIARRLPEWTFDFYGGHLRRPADWPLNIRLHPAVKHADIARLLARYEVGLIPFRNNSGRMRYVQRPLKFYEYIAAGLGVACTDIGGLRAGMGPLACYGNTPETFAAAIQQARREGRARGASFDHAFINANAWDQIMTQILARLELHRQLPQQSRLD